MSDVKQTEAVMSNLSIGEKCTKEEISAVIMSIKSMPIEDISDTVAVIMLTGRWFVATGTTINIEPGALMVIQSAEEKLFEVISWSRSRLSFSDTQLAEDDKNIPCLVAITAAHHMLHKCHLFYSRFYDQTATDMAEKIRKGESTETAGVNAFAREFAATR